VRIATLEIENFKSVGEIQTVNFGSKVTILIGLNNSGKSNILDAIQLALDSKRETRCRPDDVNSTKRLEVESDGNTTELKVASIRTHLNMNVEDRKRCFEGIRKYLENDARTNNLPIFTESNWINTLPVIQSIWEKVFNQPLTIGIDIVRRRDESFVIIPKINGFGNRWRSNHSSAFEELDTFARSISIQVVVNRGINSLIDTMLDKVITSSLAMSREIPPTESNHFIAYSEVEKNTITSKNMRNYLMRMDEMHKDAFKELRESILDSFEDIDEFSVSHDRILNKVEILLEKKSLEYELGCQGDGLKHILMFYTLLHSKRNAVILIDEPENHLHPALEAGLLDYFLAYGTGQLVIATHSDTIVSTISPEKLNSGEVTILRVSLNDKNQTVIENADEGQLLETLEELGTPITRFQLHMAASSKTLLFVEGDSDRDILIDILKKYGKYNEFRKFRPYFIPYRWISTARTFASSIVDAIRKADNSIPSPPTPHLVIRDRDEDSTSKEKDEYEFIWKVREIENLLLSKDTIDSLLTSFFDRIDLTLDNNFKMKFEKELSQKVENFIPKWLVLNFRWRVGKELRPIWTSSNISGIDEARSEIKESLEGFKTKADGEIKRLSQLDADYRSLKGQCMDDKQNLNYEYVTENLPGKRLLRLIREAMVATVINQIQDKTSEELVSISASIVQRQSVVDMCPQPHPELDRLLERISDLRIK